MGHLDPETFQWVQDDQAPVPGPVRPLGSIPPPTFNAVDEATGGGSAAQPTMPVPTAEPGNLLPVAGEVSQTSSGSSSSSSGKVETPALQEAAKDRDAASAEGIRAAVAQARAETLRAEAKNAEDERKIVEQRVASVDANRVLQEQAALKMQGQAIAQKADAQYQQELKRPDSFWGEQSTPRKILWGIALALGGFGAAVTKQQNAPLALLTKAVDDWSDNRVKRLQSVTEELKNARGWEQNAIKAHAENELRLAPIKKAAAWDSVADQMEAELAKAKAATTADGQARGMKVVAEARANAAKLREAGAMALAPMATGTQRSGTIDQAPGKPEQTTVNWQGKDFKARDVVVGRKLNEKATATTSIVQLYDKYKSLIEQYDPSFWSTGDGLSKLTQVKGEITAALKEQKALGALDNGVIRLGEMIVPDPTKFTQMFKGGNAGVISGIDSARESAIRDMQNSLISQGNKPADVKAAQPPNAGGGVRKIVNGKPAMVYPDGTYESL